MIVLVEDTQCNVMVFKRLLAKETNTDLVNQTTGMAAIQYIIENQEKIDLIVLDGNLALGYLENIPCDGPDVAMKIIALDKKIPIAVWTDDERMQARFTKLFTEKKFTEYHVIASKPIQKADIQPLINFAKIPACAPVELDEISANIGPRHS